MALIPVHDNNYKLVIYSQWTRYHWAPRPLQLTHLQFFNDAIKSIIILWPKNTYPYHLSHNPADKMTTYETRCPRTSFFHSYFSTSASKHPVCLPTIQGTKKKKSSFNLPYQSNQQSLRTTIDISTRNQTSLQLLYRFSLQMITVSLVTLA